jgi:hypothetical protein
MQDERQCCAVAHSRLLRSGEAVFSMLCEVESIDVGVMIGERTHDRAWRRKHGVEIDTQSKCLRANVLAPANRWAKFRAVL